MNLADRLRKSEELSILLIHQFKKNKKRSDYLSLLKLQNKSNLNMMMKHLSGHFSGLGISHNEVKHIDVYPSIEFPTENFLDWDINTFVGGTDIINYAISNGYNWYLEKGHIIGDSTFGSDRLKFKFKI